MSSVKRAMCPIPSDIKSGITGQDMVLQDQGDNMIVKRDGFNTSPLLVVLERFVEQSIIAPKYPMIDKKETI
jgi:hypothetical protein